MIVSYCSGALAAATSGCALIGGLAEGALTGVGWMSAALAVRGGSDSSGPLWWCLGGHCALPTLIVTQKTTLPAPLLL